MVIAVFSDIGALGTKKAPRLERGAFFFESNSN